MKYGLRHIGLTIGILSAIFSFLFFGRQQGTYDKLFTVGLVMSIGCYLAILMGKDTKKAKLIWTGIVAMAAIVQQLSAPILADTSYRIYINQNKRELDTINAILLQRQGDISIMKDTLIDKQNTLTVEEKATLKRLRGKVNSYWIAKTNDHVYVGLWGFLDVRLGITHWPEDTKPGKQYQHLTGNWYH